MKKRSMLRLGNFLLGSRPAVAVPFSGKVTASSLRLAKRGGMDIAELRLDHFSAREKNTVAADIRKLKGVPLIATIRSKKEGGQWNGSENERLGLFKRVLPGVQAVDIELSSKTILKDVIGEAKRLGKVAIVSYHNFDKTPGQESLKKILKEARAAGADVVKIAAMARSKKDLRALAEFTGAHAGENIITLSMGNMGAVSRLLFPLMGSLLTFAHLGRSTAPGQYGLKTTSLYIKKLYSLKP